MFAAFAKDGPTPEELTVAKKQMANLLEEIMKTPDFWLGRLSTLDYRGLDLDDLLDAPAQYQRFTAAAGPGGLCPLQPAGGAPPLRGHAALTA